MNSNLLVNDETDGSLLAASKPPYVSPKLTTIELNKTSGDSGNDSPTSEGSPGGGADAS